MLAKELLSKPDGFIIANYMDGEYIIGDIKRVSTHANIDDSTMHWTLNLRDGGNGNLKRQEDGYGYKYYCWYKLFDARWNLRNNNYVYCNIRKGFR